MTTAIKSVSVSIEFAELAEKHHLSWTEASRVGMSILLAELGVRDYDNNLNLYRKMMVFKQRAEEALAKMYELEEKMKKYGIDENKPASTP